MQAESLEVLEKADVAPAQARAIVRAIEIEISGAKEILATKSDLALLRRDLRQEMSGLREEMSRLGREIRQEMSDLRLEVKGGLLRLETKIHESASGITRQLYRAILGQMAVLLGFAYFFATHVR